MQRVEKGKGEEKCVRDREKRMMEKEEVKRK